MRRRSRAAAVLALAAVVLGATACGPAGELATQAELISRLV